MPLSVRYSVDGIEGVIELLDEVLETESAGLSSRIKRDQDMAESAGRALKSLRSKLERTDLRAPEPRRSIANGRQIEPEGLA